MDTQFCGIVSASKSDKKISTSIKCSSLLGSEYDKANLLNDSDSYFCSQNQIDSYIDFSFDNPICPEKYLLQSAPLPTNSFHLKNWKLLAKNELNAWVELDSHQNCSDLNGISQTHIYPLQCKQSFYIFRLLQTGVNWADSNILSLKKFDISTGGKNSPSPKQFTFSQQNLAFSKTINILSSPLSDSSCPIANIITNSSSPIISKFTYNPFIEITLDPGFSSLSGFIFNEPTIFHNTFTEFNLLYSLPNSNDLTQQINLPFSGGDNIILPAPIETSHIKFVFEGYNSFIFQNIRFLSSQSGSPQTQDGKSIKNIQTFSEADNFSALSLLKIHPNILTPSSTHQNSSSIDSIFEIHKSKEWFSEDKPNQFILAPFSPSSFILKSYSFAGSIENKLNFQPISWVIEGSNEGRLIKDFLSDDYGEFDLSFLEQDEKWFVLDTHKNDYTNIKSPMSFKINNNEEFKFYRFRQIGPNSTGSDTLCLSDIKFFGDYIRSESVQSFLSFPPTKGLPFDGIITHLISTNGNKNPAKIGLVDVSASSVWENDHQPFLIFEYSTNDYFASSNSPNSYLIFHFKKDPIYLTHYTIKTRNFDPGTGHMKTWKLEGSNDKKSWTTMDVRTNVNDLNGKLAWKTYEVSNPGIFSYFKLTMTDENLCGEYYMNINAVEFFGSIGSPQQDQSLFIHPELNDYFNKLIDLAQDPPEQKPELTVPTINFQRGILGYLLSKTIKFSISASDHLESQIPRYLPLWDDDPSHYYATNGKTAVHALHFSFTDPTYICGIVFKAVPNYPLPKNFNFFAVGNEKSLVYKNDNKIIEPVMISPDVYVVCFKPDLSKGFIKYDLEIRTEENEIVAIKALDFLGGYGQKPTMKDYPKRLPCEDIINNDEIEFDFDIFNALG